METVEEQKQRILVVDDHSIVRRGFATLINQQRDMIVCGEAETAEEALRQIENCRPDLAIIDLSLKDSISGIDLIREIKRQFPGVLMLVVSMHDESLYTERVLRAGAKGYIMKQEVDSEMIRALRCVLNGGVYLSESMNSQILSGDGTRRTRYSESMIEQLSDREFEVFRLLGRGLGTRRIAETLNVGIKTVETFRSRIKEKLGIEDGNQLVQVAVEWAVRNGIT
ncbi:MAG TPA: response regulator transcription factor [Candidatus Hydrogenedentes bacterium]|nr:response regulator transcription factor [Candidatus Hydrogenedentota bacterium]